MRFLCMLLLIVPLFASAQSACNSMPEDKEQLCLQKRKTILEKARSIKGDQLKACVRDRLEDSPERQEAELKEFDAGEKLWRKQSEYNCRIHAAAFYDGTAREGQFARCEIREVELRTARFQELGLLFNCFDAKGKAR